MSQWLDYSSQVTQHTVVGNLKVRHKVKNPYNHNQRDILVYLPPSYNDGNKRYPVIYMQDGQNLFDAHTSYSGEWYVDDSVLALSHEGLEVIVVGIPNMGADRIHEYSPFPDPEHGGGQGEKYVSFIVEKLKPIIDRDFRTLSDKENTAIMGSSMGGLISMYAFFRFPDVFGMVGAMSPSFWFAQREIFDYVEQAPYHAGRIYLDMGTNEAIGIIKKGGMKLTPNMVEHMRDILAAKGYCPNEDLLYLLEQGAGHTEPAWAHRFPLAVKFLVGHASGQEILAQLKNQKIAEMSAVRLQMAA